jgi:cytochrome c556
MKRRQLLPLAFVSVLAVVSSASIGQHAAPEPRGIDLSPALLELLREEMREITVGVQVIAASLATANWEAIRQAGAAIRASYIMGSSLTPEQAAELDRALPEQFKRLDAEFHERAARLAMAAEARDAEIVGFQYARLLETCTRCHAQFAGGTFPGFVPPATQEHRH